MALGKRDPVGKFPALSDLASKGKCWSEVAASTDAGRLSRCPQPVKVPANNRRTKTVRFRPVLFFNFMKQSCRPLPPFHKSQAGCHLECRFIIDLVKRWKISV